MSLLGLDDFLAEVDNNLDYSVATDQELEGFIGEVGRMPANSPRRRAFAKRIEKSSGNKSSVLPTNDLTVQSEFALRANQLPTQIRAAIAGGKLKVVNGALYAIRAMSQLSHLELMANADTKAPGVTNVNNRKLEANSWFLLIGISIQSAVNATPHAGSFGIPAPAILNGEFQLKNGSKIIIPTISMSRFDTTNVGNVSRAFMKLENPKWLAPETEIVPELKLPAATAINTAVKLILWGATLEKA